MKRIFVSYIALAFFFYFSSPISAHGQEAEDNTTLMPSTITLVQKEKYEYMLSLPPVNLPEDVLQRIDWIIIDNTRKKKKSPEQKKKDNPPIVVTSIQYEKSKYTNSQTPTLTSTDVFGPQAENLKRHADNTNDPQFKSIYRQMTISSLETSIAYMEATQSLDRAASSVGLMSSVLDLAGSIGVIMVNKKTREHMDHAIEWAFGPGYSFYTRDKNAPVLILTFYAENQAYKNGLHQFNYMFSAKVKYKDELIELPVHTFEMLYYNKNYIEKHGVPKKEGYFSLDESTLPLEHTKMEIGEYSPIYSLHAMQLRQVAHDFAIIKKLLDEEN